jgi:hypothetical protein
MKLLVLGDIVSTSSLLVFVFEAAICLCFAQGHEAFIVNTL